MDATKINRGRSKKGFACFKPPVVDEPGRDFSADDAAGTRKKRLRRSFSAALKAVFFKTSLVRIFNRHLHAQFAFWILFPYLFQKMILEICFFFLFLILNFVFCIFLNGSNCYFSIPTAGRPVLTFLL